MFISCPQVELGLLSPLSPQLRISYGLYIMIYTCSTITCMFNLILFYSPHETFFLFFHKGVLGVCSIQETYKQPLVTAQQVSQIKCLNCLWTGFAFLEFFWLFTLLTSVTLSTYWNQYLQVWRKQVYGNIDRKSLQTEEINQMENIKAFLKHTPCLTWINYWCKICILKRTTDLQI